MYGVLRLVWPSQNSDTSAWVSVQHLRFLWNPSWLTLELCVVLSVVVATGKLAKVSFPQVLQLQVVSSWELKVEAWCLVSSSSFFYQEDPSVRKQLWLLDHFDSVPSCLDKFVLSPLEDQFILPQKSENTACFTQTWNIPVSPWACHIECLTAVIFIALSHSPCPVQTLQFPMLQITQSLQVSNPVSSLWLPELAASYLSFLHLTLPSWSPFDNGEGY